MIQRKQSIYLLIASLLTGVLLITHVADFISKEANYILNFKGIYIIENGNVQSDAIFAAYPLMLLIPLSTLISIVTILLFRKRILQIRLCGINVALQAGITASIFYLGYAGAKNLEAVVSYQYVVVFPLIALILTILAIISIGKDEALVRSLNRIR